MCDQQQAIEILGEVYTACTEQWLDIIEERTDYRVWLCGHWHINKSIDKLNFLYDGVISSQEIERSIHNGARENRERGLKIK